MIVLHSMFSLQKARKLSLTLTRPVYIYIYIYIAPVNIHSPRYEVKPKMKNYSRERSYSLSPRETSQGVSIYTSHVEKEEDKKTALPLSIGLANCALTARSKLN